MTKLRAIELEKKYKQRQVVNKVSLEVASGEIVGLLGPNGAGKTTCFYMIVGLVTANNGQVLLNDTVITHLPMHLRAKAGIGYLPQEPSVFRKLSVQDNILAILEVRQDIRASDRRLLLKQLMKEFNIEHVADSLGISLSGGERRRVEIARAVAANPKFMLLDEPFAGVDPISVGDIKSIIQHLSRRNIGVLITDHNVRETLDICQRAYIMGAGQLITQGTPQEILLNADVRAVYLGNEFEL